MVNEGHNADGKRKYMDDRSSLLACYRALGFLVLASRRQYMALSIALQGR